MAVVGSLVLVACSGSDAAEVLSSDTTADEEVTDTDPPDTEAPATDAPVETEAPAETEVATTTTTTPPETTTTTSTTTTTTTTTSTTTTTIDPRSENDLTAIILFGDIEAGNEGARSIVDAIIADLERPTYLDRVDIVSASIADNVMELIIVGTSGYSTPEIVQEITVDVVTYLADIWADIDALCCGNNTAPRVNLTIDGANYILERDVLLAVDNRQMTPQQALGI